MYAQGMQKQVGKSLETEAYLNGKLPASEETHTANFRQAKLIIDSATENLYNHLNGDAEWHWSHTNEDHRDFSEIARCCGNNFYFVTIMPE